MSNKLNKNQLDSANGGSSEWGYSFEYHIVETNFTDTVCEVGFASSDLALSSANAKKENLTASNPTLTIVFGEVKIDSSDGAASIRAEVIL